MLGYGLLIGKPCSLYYAGDPYEEWEIGTMGQLLVPDYPSYTYVNACIELMHNDPLFGNGLTPFYCFEDDEKNTSDAR